MTDPVRADARGMTGLLVATPALPDRPFTASEITGLGLTRPLLREQITLGLLRSPYSGVYIPAHLPDSPELRIRAVALVTTAHHVICDRSAGWVHGVDSYALAETQEIPKVETCALRGHRSTRLRGTRGRTRDLSSDDIMTIAGIRVTTPLRTALDLGCNLRRREAMAALVGFARLHGITAQMLAKQLPRFRRRRGVVQLRTLLPLVDPRIESQRESWVWLELHDRGLPTPVPQHWIEINGVKTYRLDFAWVRAKVCVEYDGVDFHDKTDEQRRADKERRDWLRAHGWTVIVVHLGDFTGDALDRWIHDVREALRPAYSTLRF